jgi:hypothetical protein
LYLHERRRDGRDGRDEEMQSRRDGRDEEKKCRAGETGETERDSKWVSGRVTALPQNYICACLTTYTHTKHANNYYTVLPEAAIDIPEEVTRRVVLEQLGALLVVDPAHDHRRAHCPLTRLLRVHLRQVRHALRQHVHRHGVPGEIWGCGGQRGGERGGECGETGEGDGETAGEEEETERSARQRGAKEAHCTLWKTKRPSPHPTQHTAHTKTN